MLNRGGVNRGNRQRFKTQPATAKTPQGLIQGGRDQKKTQILDWEGRGEKNRRKNTRTWATKTAPGGQRKPRAVPKAGKTGSG